MSNGPKLRAKRIACRLAAELCERNMERGDIEKERASLEKDSPSVAAIEAGMRELIEELVKRGRSM